MPRPAPRLHLASRGHEVATSREERAIGGWDPSEVGEGALGGSIGIVVSGHRIPGFQAPLRRPIPQLHHCRHQHSLMIPRIDRPERPIGACRRAKPTNPGQQLPCGIDCVLRRLRSDAKGGMRLKPLCSDCRNYFWLEGSRAWPGGDPKPRRGCAAEATACTIPGRDLRS